MPARIQRRRTKGASMGDAVYVGRGPGQKWGNPYRAYDSSAREHLLAASQFVCLLVGREDSPHPDLLVQYPSDEEIVRELAGRDLACWCPPDHACHADALLAVANGLSLEPLVADLEARFAAADGVTA